MFDVVVDLIDNHAEQENPANPQKNAIEHALGFS